MCVCGNCYRKWGAGEEERTMFHSSCGGKCAVRINQGSGKRIERGGQGKGQCFQGVLVVELRVCGCWGSNAPPSRAQNFTASGEAESRRCAQREELLARGCPVQELEEPRGHQEVLEDKPLSQGDRGEGATQLAPQRIRVTLRPGGFWVARGDGSLGWASNAQGS